MDGHEQQKATGFSKREMARKISGSVNAKSNEEILMREQDRRQIEKELRTRPASKPVNNPYMSPQEDHFQQAQEDYGEEQYEEEYPPESYIPPRMDKPAPPPQMRGGDQFGGDYNAVFSELPPPARRPRVRKEREARQYIERRNAERARRRAKQRRKQLIISLVAVLVIIGAVGAGGVLWFRNGKKSYDGIFLDNTYINGVKVGKMNVTEAVQVVRQYSDMPDVITLTRPDGVDVTVPLTDLDSKDNILQNVDTFFNEQNHNDWLKARTSDTNYSFKLEFSFDRQKLYKEVNRKVVEGQKSVKPQNARIEKTSDGFRIVPEVVGTAIDKKKVQTLYDFIDGFLDRGSYSIDLKNCNCYKLPKVTSEDLREELGMLNNLYDVQFTIDYGIAQETLEGKTVLNWITFDDASPLDGFSVDEDSVYNYVKEVAERHDTFGKERQFHSTTRGDMVIGQGNGCYGWLTDYDKTTALLIDLIKDCTSATFQPYWYTTEGGFNYSCNPDWLTADTDFSNTYCEVDLSQQHFRYYLNGELKYQCDIVSGLPTATRNTQGGVYKLWYKEANKTLVGSNADGESWVTPVDYWNDISTCGVGLHDATWHDSFGGNRYTWAGSHGCVNMPWDAAKYVYENIDLNTPVFMYW